MCTRTTCRSCGKPTYSGCGAHIEMVLGDVPQDKRCKCREVAPKAEAKEGGGASWWPFGKKS